MDGIHNDTTMASLLADNVTELVNSTITAMVTSNLTNNNAEDDDDEEILGPYSQAAIFCFSLIVIVAFCYCSQPNVVPPEMRRGAQIRQRYEEQQQRLERESKLADPKLREEAIRQALIVKQIIRVDDRGEMILGEVDPEAAADHDHDDSETTDDYENEDSACVICLEPFRCGDVVAWSLEVTKGSDCQHVFHRECIGEWLQNTKHDDCPSCRTIFLHPADEEDDMKGNMDVNTDMDMDTDMDMHVLQTIHSQDEEWADDMPPPETATPTTTTTASSMAFVIMNGLISRARGTRYSLIGQQQQVDMDHSFGSDDDCNTHSQDHGDGNGEQHRHRHRQHQDGATPRLPTMPPPSSLRRAFSVDGHNKSMSGSSWMRRSFRWGQSAVAAEPERSQAAIEFQILDGGRGGYHGDGQTPTNNDVAGDGDGHITLVPVRRVSIGPGASPSHHHGKERYFGVSNASTPGEVRLRRPSATATATVHQPVVDHPLSMASDPILLRNSSPPVSPRHGQGEGSRRRSISFGSTLS